MNFEEYQNFTKSVDRKPVWSHIFAGLVSELGELATHYQKHERDGRNIDPIAIEKELGDILWHLSEMCSLHGFSFDEVAQQNVKKLKDRVARNVLHGSGDNR